MITLNELELRADRARARLSRVLMPLRRVREERARNADHRGVWYVDEELTRAEHELLTEVILASADYRRAVAAARTGENVGGEGCS